MNKFLQTLIVCIYMSCFSNDSKAQEWKHYTSYSNTTCSLNMKDSTSWVGTRGGVIHYDKNYKIIEAFNNSNGLDSNVVSLALDVKDRIWASDERKTYVFDGKVWLESNKIGLMIIAEKPILFYSNNNEKWISYDRGTKFVKIGKDSVYTSYDLGNNGLKRFTNIPIAQDKSGNIWLIDDYKLLQFDGKTWKSYDNNNSSLPFIYIYKNKLIVDKDSGIVFKNGDQIIKFYPKTNETRKLLGGLDITLGNTADDKILLGNNGKVYEYYNDRLIFLFELDTKVYTYIISLEQNIKGNILINYQIAEASFSDYNYEYKNIYYDGKTLIPLEQPEMSLTSNFIPIIGTDALNNIWIGPYGGEKVVRMNETKKETLVLPFSASEFCQGEGNDFWLGSQNRILQCKQDSGLQVKEYNLGYAFKQIVMDSKKQIWVSIYIYGKLKTLAWFKDEVWNWFSINENIKTILPKAGGGVWVLTDNGLGVFDGVAFKKINAPNLPKRIYSIYVDPSFNLWVLEYNQLGSTANIFKYNGVDFEKIIFPSDFKVKNYYNFIIDSKGNFWSFNDESSSGSEIQKFEPNNQNKITTYNKSNTPNLPYSIVTMSESKDGKIWFGTFKAGVFSLTTNCNESIPLKIKPQSKANPVLETQSTSLEVNVNNATNYQWEVSKDKGSNWTGITNFDSTYSGQRTYTLAINSVNKAQNGYSYRCQISSQCNTATSDTIILTVKQCPEIQIIQQPNNQSTLEKSGVQFVVRSSNTSTYQWEVSTDSALTWKQISSQDTLYSGQQTNTLSIKSTNISQNSNSYRCLLKNECFQIYSLPASLEVITILGNEALIEKSFIAYPNPAYDNLQVKVPVKPFKLTLLSDKGSVIKQVENQDIISVKDIHNGIYILLLETDKGKQSLKIAVLK
ncbi:T9SS type A sorting domain-containing protein [Arcicella sp. DC2W]|uniref:T9SS type A sorting domain-containing protein n=1 Tax=Arcicella gelida TaxID=2984195 RepID=A0ABU5RZ66_9BACT|nr:T9SS type A sorting domain-containing protein [Arcicella sp. DC2W]MEA5401441.1 T9SS type A sorting domain-containing protein [Arcicella sp. DC2W]